MPVEVEWDNAEKSTLLVSYIQRWTWEEAYSARAQFHAYLGATERMVDVIVDYRVDWYPPPNFGDNLDRITSNLPTNLGLVVMVSRGLLPELYEAFLHSYGPRRFSHAFAVSLNEARRVIGNYRQGYWSPPAPPDPTRLH